MWRSVQPLFFQAGSIGVLSCVDRNMGRSMSAIFGSYSLTNGWYVSVSSSWNRRLNSSTSDSYPASWPTRVPPVVYNDEYDELISQSLCVLEEPTSVGLSLIHIVEPIDELEASIYDYLNTKEFAFLLVSFVQTSLWPLGISSNSQSCAIFQGVVNFGSHSSHVDRAKVTRTKICVLYGERWKRKPWERPRMWPNFWERKNAKAYFLEVNILWQS